MNGSLNLKAKPMNTPDDYGMVEISREQFGLLKDRHFVWVIAKKDVVDIGDAPWDECTYFKNCEEGESLLATCRISGEESFFRASSLREIETPAESDGGQQALSNSTDPVNHPPHYNTSSIEPIDVIEAWNLGFCLGNTVKYIARAPHKGSEIEDLKKARWYLDRRIRQLETEIETSDESSK